MFHVKHSFYLAYFLKFVYYNLDATDIVESGQDWKIAALTLNICVHLFLGVNMDDFYMTEALKLARKAFKAGEVPIGAIIVDNNRIIGKGYNQKEKKKNSLKHAELIAIDEASKSVGDWRLNNCVLYTTLFPCPMCASAIQQSRIKKIYYILESKDLFSFELSKKILNTQSHKVEIEKINLNTSILNDFFYKIRLK